MTKILANDGIHPDGKLLLEEANYIVDTQRIPQEELATKLPEYDAIIVRSATKVRAELIEKCPKLKLIARAGVGLDNIDVKFAEERGIRVINTPNASSMAVAELVLGQMYTLARFLHISNRAMPKDGDSKFKALKKQFSKGSQIYGQTLGIIGMGRIGQALASLAKGVGMRVLGSDLVERNIELKVGASDFSNSALSVQTKTVSFDKVLRESDFISIHVSGNQTLIGREEIAKMKDGVFLINTSRGGVIDENVLVESLNSKKVAGAALDVYEGEPTPKKALLNHPNISLTPHIGASTLAAQRNIGLELADALIDFFGTD